MILGILFFVAPGLQSRGRRRNTLRRPVATCQLKYFRRFLASCDASGQLPAHRALFVSHVPREDGIVTTDGSGVVVDGPVGAESDPEAPQSLSSGMRGRSPYQKLHRHGKELRMRAPRRLALENGELMAQGENLRLELKT